MKMYTIDLIPPRTNEINESDGGSGSGLGTLATRNGRSGPWERYTFRAGVKSILEQCRDSEGCELSFWRCNAQCTLLRRPASHFEKSRSDAQI